MGKAVGEHLSEVRGSWLGWGEFEPSCECNRGLSQFCEKCCASSLFRVLWSWDQGSRILCDPLRISSLEGSCPWERNMNLDEVFLFSWGQFLQTLLPILAAAGRLKAAILTAHWTDTERCEISLEPICCFIENLWETSDWSHNEEMRIGEIGEEELLLLLCLK